MQINHQNDAGVLTHKSGRLIAIKLINVDKARYEGAPTSCRDRLPCKCGTPFHPMGLRIMFPIIWLEVGVSLLRQTETDGFCSKYWELWDMILAMALIIGLEGVPE
jgi:hypothetical protein